MEIKCPKCKKRYEVDGVVPGQEIQSVCPRCNNHFNYVIPNQVHTAAPVPVAPAAVAPAAPAAVTVVEQPAVAQTEVVRTHSCHQCGGPVNDGASYCPECGAYQLAGPDPKAQPAPQPQVVYVQQPAPQMNYSYSGPRLHDRNKITAALLAIFLGGLGIHKFYLGQTGMGFLYLIFCWTWIPSIIAFVEFIIYLTTSDADFDAKYNYQ